MLKMKRLLAAFILVLLAAPATAKDVDKGLVADKRGDYSAALREWRPFADSFWSSYLDRMGVGDYLYFNLTHAG